MIAGALALSLFLAQAPPDEGPPPPPSPPPLISAPEGPAVQAPPRTPLQESMERPIPREPARAQPDDRRPEEGDEPAPGTPTAWWKRSLVSLGIAAGVGGSLAAGAALLSFEMVCSTSLCGGSDLFAIFAIAGLTATFTIPAAVSIVGRALGGRAKYGHALIGSGLFGAAGLIVALATTGGSDVPLFVIPVFGSLMVLGAVASFELFSFGKEPKVKAEPVLGLLPGGGMAGLRASF